MWRLPLVMGDILLNNYCVRGKSFVPEVTGHFKERLRAGRGSKQGLNGNPLHFSCLANSMDRGAW